LGPTGPLEHASPVTVELTRFRVAPGDTGRLLHARLGMLADFSAGRAGFLGASLVRLADNQWLDVVWWRSNDDLVLSRSKGANLPGVTAFFGAIGEVLASEEGATAEWPLLPPGLPTAETPAG
jgi:hypothetical protein